MGYFRRVTACKQGICACIVPYTVWGLLAAVYKERIRKCSTVAAAAAKRHRIAHIRNAGLQNTAGAPNSASRNEP